MYRGYLLPLLPLVEAQQSHALHPLPLEAEDIPMETQA